MKIKLNNMKDKQINIQNFKKICTLYVNYFLIPQSAMLATQFSFQLIKC
jgi:hypothetical protein